MKRHFSLRKLSIVTGVACALFISLWAAAPEASAHGNAGLGRVYYINYREAVNWSANRLEVNGHVQINRPGRLTATMIDTARAFSSCKGCNTFAVALQINLISPDAVNDKFWVTAVAKNYRCTGCTTEAIAMQMDVITNDYRHVPHSVRVVVSQLNQELSYLSSHPHTSLSAAERRIGDVVAQFQSLRFSDPPSGAGAARVAAHPQMRTQWVRTTRYNSAGS